MIKFENTEICGIGHAIRGMRNAMNSWDKSDSYVDERYNTAHIGENDKALMKRLFNAGTDHRKYLRMITVYADITAPLYWVAEHDTYKIGTVRNSCSFMHKGLSKPFEINDFSVDDDRIYYLLNDIKTEKVDVIYPYETDEYRLHTTNTGRKYKIFKNGRVVSCAFEKNDNYKNGRLRHFPEKECIPYMRRDGYYQLNIGGRGGERWLLHRLIASTWIDNNNNLETVNHINGNKRDNSVENLEWASRTENIKMAFEQGLMDKNKFHSQYYKWKNAHKYCTPTQKSRIVSEFKGGTKSLDEIMLMNNIREKTIQNMVYQKQCENAELFFYTYYWECAIKTLNILRDEYLKTKDNNTFHLIRQMLPQGYNVKYTWCANYEVLANIYKSRQGHKLKEWHEFIEWIEGLPYTDIFK